MLISKVSDMSNKMHTMDIDVTDEQLQDWREGTAIQDAMPNLTPDEREFIKTGITPKEWDEMFGDAGDE
tara:strand:- start:347 stop:553 length:207 start_codon:yes stop_codon:yes gene_type:complete